MSYIILNTLFFMISNQNAHDTILSIPMNEFVKYAESAGINKSDFTFKGQIEELGNAHFFLLPDGRALIMPNGGTRSYPCFIFPNENALLNYYKTQKLSIPDSCRTIYELEESLIRKIPSNGINDFVNAFAKHTGYNFLDINYESLETGLDLLRNARKNVSIDEYQKISLAYSIILCEYFKDQYAATWVLIEDKNGYYKYVRPGFQVKGKTADIIAILMQLISERKNNFNSIESVIKMKLTMQF